MNPENIQKHAVAIDQQVSNLVINTLRQSLAQASAEIEELKAKIVSLEAPKETPNEAK